MSYTMFVNIVSWLSSKAWTDRMSVLDIGDEVTVEPREASQCGSSVQPATGSFWAEIVKMPSETEASERCVYGVRRHGAQKDQPPEMIERQYLRHRKLHTKVS